MFELELELESELYPRLLHLDLEAFLLEQPEVLDKIILLPEEHPPDLEVTLGITIGIGITDLVVTEGGVIEGRVLVGTIGAGWIVCLTEGGVGITKGGAGITTGGVGITLGVVGITTRGGTILVFEPSPQFLVLILLSLPKDWELEEFELVELSVFDWLSFWTKSFRELLLDP